MFQGIQSTRSSQNTLYRGPNNGIERRNEESNSVGVPDALTFTMPDGARFTIKPVDASFSLKDLAKSLHEGGGNSTRAFSVIELARSFNFSFGGRSYPADTLLSAIHEEMNLNDCGDVFCVATEAKAAADKLKSSSGLEWRVLNENRVMLDSNPYEKEADAVNFAKNALSRMPDLEPHVDWQVKRMKRLFYVEMLVRNRQSIRMIARGTPIEIGLAAPAIAQALRNGNQSGLGMLPLDILSRLGMFLLPEPSHIDGFQVMQTEIENANMEYHHAPVFRRIAPVVTGEIEQSIAETASVLLRWSADNLPESGKDLKVCHVGLSNAGLMLDFSDGIYAGNFMRAMKNAGYKAAVLEWKSRDEINCGPVAEIEIRDFNEVKRFVEATCGFDEHVTKALFKLAAKELRLSSKFFIQELETIGNSIGPMSLDEKKAAAKRFMQAYLPYLDRNEVDELKKLVTDRSRPDSEGRLGSLQYLREKRGAGRIFSINNYSDDVATFKQLIAAIEGLKD